MGIVNMVQTIKKVHEHEIVLVKVGQFYSVYGKDAYIKSTKLLVPRNGINE